MSGIRLSYHEPGYVEQVQDLLARARKIQPPGPKLMRAAFIAVAIGTLGFLVGLFAVPGRMWGAFDANFLFWVGISQGAVVLAATFNASNSKWGRPLQRMIEALGGFLIFSPVLMLILWLGRTHLFIWLDQPGRSSWLNAGWLLARDELVLIFMTGISLFWLYRSIRPDLRLIHPVGNDRFTQWMMRRWQGDAHEVERTGTVLRNLAPGLIISYCFLYSVLSIDLAMTLDPEYKSTMFPGIYWISEFLAPIGLLAVLLWAWRRWNSTVHDLITPAQRLDLGNMVWAFAIFRTWFDWSQYIIIWYANFPDEARWLILRWRAAPWSFLAYSGLILAFIAPFFLGFSRRFKQGENTLPVLGGMVVLGVLADRFMEVMPSVAGLGPGDFGLVELAITVGFAGLVALPYLWLLQRAPIFPISDPMFATALKTRGVPET